MHFSQFKDFATAAGPLRTNVRKHDRLIFYVSFAYVMLDTFWNYFLNNIFGVTLQINALLPVLYLSGILLYRSEITLPAASYLLCLLALFLSLSIGGLIATNALLPTLMKNASLVVSFLIGYTCARNCRTENTFFVALAAVSVVYTITCAIAVLELAPTLFPVRGGYNILAGELVFRYEITTDQNFQVLYCIGSTTLLVIARKLHHFIGLLALTALNFFVISELQTRSGFIVLTLVVLLAAFVRLRRLEAVPGILFAIGGLLILTVAGLLLAPLLSEHFQPIILRFAESDYRTLGTRVHAVEVFFRMLSDPERWVPLDPTYYWDTFGNLPHFSPTMLILNGGIVAIIGWFYVLLLPGVMILMLTLFRKRSSKLLNVVALNAVAALIVYMSAPIYAWDVVWLWGGAALGCLMREKHERVLS